jgi:hypothetical protein
VLFRSATGATGATGASGVISVTSPITNTGSSTAAQIGINQSLLTISPSQVIGTAADLADNTFTGKQTLAPSTTAAASLNLANGTAPTSPTTGDLWAASGSLIYQSSLGGQTLAFLSSNITGNAATAGTATYATTSGTAVNVSGTIAYTNVTAPTDTATIGVGGVYFTSNPASTAINSPVTFPTTTTVRWTINHGLNRWPLATTILNIDGSNTSPSSFGFCAGTVHTGTTTISRASGGVTTATATTTVAHGLIAGAVIAVSKPASSAVSAGGVWTVGTVLNGTQFTFTTVGTATIAGGTAQLSSNLPNYQTLQWTVGTAVTSIAANQYKAVLLG